MQSGKLSILRGVLLFLAIAALPGLALADADFGDAPSQYPDAWHGIAPDDPDYDPTDPTQNGGAFEWLGAAWDAELRNANDSVDALGDDTAGVDDEDGVNFVYDGTTSTLNIYVTMSVANRFYRDPSTFLFRYRESAFGEDRLLYLRGWWDENNDGAFDYVNENIIYANYNPRTQWTANNYTAHFQVPNFTPRDIGDVFRFRLAYGGPSARAITASGGTEFGEVEDYFITPEPASLALLGAGVAFLIRRRRRRK